MMRPVHPYVVCDVFTDRPLEGNQLAVFTEGAAVPEELLQALARETNLSETVFVLPPAEGGDARVRIFTTVTELPFAGHPVLGTAIVLAARLGSGEVVLETGRGKVPVRIERPGFGRMQQPIPTVEPFAETDALFAALGVDRAELPVEVYDNGVRHLYVALASAEDVVAVAPDLGRLAALLGPQGVSTFAPEDGDDTGTRWKTRMFIPGAGVAEDPATGSAAGPLALHLARHGRIAFGQEIEISQGVEIRRPSTLFARVDGDADAVTAISVAGSAVEVAEGSFRL
jgi:trans-2,3-dihydro-3-hydroxyanthranilate isomerase